MDTVDSLTGLTRLVYSVIVPLRDEADNIQKLIHSIEQVMQSLDGFWELICVDDGSIDATPHLLKQEQRRSSFLKVVTFDRSYGQSDALAAGFSLARGEFVITLDGDLQNDPADIANLIMWMSDYDLVCGHRFVRHDFWLKRVISYGANAIRSRVCKDGVSDTGCSLKIFRRSCLRKIKMYEGMHRFLPALFSIEGFRVREVFVTHRPRTRGRSKYPLTSRLLKPVVDMCAVAWMRRRQLKYRIKEESP